jgi:hypothetical protein
LRRNRGLHGIDLFLNSIDLKVGLLTVAYALQRVKGRGLELVEPKSEFSRRTLRLSQGALAALKEHRLQH